MPENDPGGYTSFRDMFDGGGPGRSGSRFEGGGIISDIGNAMGGPSMFGGEGGNRGAAVGRTVGGAMFGPLGMIGGGILGNMLGGGMNRGLAQGVSPVPAPAPRSAASPAMAALSRPMQRPYQPADPYMQTSGQQAPSFQAAMPSAVERFMMQYGGMPDQITNAYPQGNLRMIPGAVPYNLPPITFDALTGQPMAMMPPRAQ